jgi:hypothetical protein
MIRGIFLMDPMKFSALAFGFTVIIGGHGAWASSSDAWAALDKASAKACISASGFLKAKASPSIHYSDDVGFDARVVSGVYPQKHMKGASGKMLCLYGRESKRVEVQDMTP